MEHPLTIAENKLDRTFDLIVSLEQDFSSRPLAVQKVLRSQIIAASLAYAAAFEECVSQAAWCFSENYKLAEIYVNIAREARLKDPQGFKARVDNAIKGNFLVFKH